MTYDITEELNEFGFARIDVLLEQQIYLKHILVLPEQHKSKLNEKFSCASELAALCISTCRGVSKPEHIVGQAGEPAQGIF
ncbi:MAG: hypothetical protein MJE68_22340 [Proteobacteria bacterium]|nr:hypothetical protein [Pseudomonadota bacterium]